MSPSPGRNLDDFSGNAHRTPTDGKRRTKRFIWTDDLHVQFVSAIFELGVKNATPKALLELMETKCPTEGLTTEHIKSHLQKYRINHERSQTLQSKRSFKRHRRQIPPREAEDVVVSETQPQNQPWNLCDALLHDDSEQMHSTMQQRMDFHRELLLTRSVEVGSGLSWATRMNSLDTMQSTDEDTINSSFLQAWANAEQLRQQENTVFGRLHQQQQSLFQQTQDAMPATAFSANESKPMASLQKASEDDGGMDLTSWGRLSLTVDSDDEDVFGFLGA